MKIFTLSLIFLTFGPTMYAQIMLGPKAGFTFSQQNRNSDFEVNKRGVQYGAVVIIPLKGNFSIQTELLFTEKGYREDFGSSEVYDELTAHYLEIPGYLHVQKDLYKLKFFTNMGFYMALWRSGTYKSRLELGGEILTEYYAFTGTFDADGFSDNRKDFGLSLGLGFIYPVNNSNLMLDLRFNRGLVDPNNLENPPTDYIAQFNKNWALSLTYLFYL